MSPAEKPDYIGLFCCLNGDFLCRNTYVNRRFPFAAGLELPKNEYQIRRADRNQKSISLFYYPEKEKTNYATERISQAAQIPI